MDIISMYSVRIKEYRHIFKESLQIYRSAVDFFIDVCLKEWDFISVIKGSKKQQSFVESLTLPTDKRPEVSYNFNDRFYKMPCYLRRAAISEAIGKVSSYKSNLSNWESSDPHSRGEEPSYPKAGYCYPALYKGYVCACGRLHCKDKGLTQQYMGLDHSAAP